MPFQKKTTFETYVSNFVSEYVSVEEKRFASLKQRKVRWGSGIQVYVGGEWTDVCGNRECYCMTYYYKGCSHCGECG